MKLQYVKPAVRREVSLPAPVVLVDTSGYEYSEPGTWENE